MKTFLVEVLGHDRLEVEFKGEEISSVKAIGCFNFLELINKYVNQYGFNISNWVVPEGKTHQDLLLKQLILKVRGLWKSCSQLGLEDELCHCRKIPSRVVDDCIHRGFADIQSIRRLTSANTACGTCLPEVEKLITERLKSF
jgi:bacterioferritin-associated ferredoxin